MIIEKAFAKVNLILRVGDKQPNGYHSLFNVMTPIDLFDVLYFEKIKEGIEIIDDTGIPVEQNFIYQAALLFKNNFHIKKGVRIRVVKNIPTMAGLAGGSSDASATLRGMNRLFRKGISNENLVGLAKELGSDMPYCLYQSLSFCTGRGDIVNSINYHFKRIPLTLIKPSFGLSTKEVYNYYENSHAEVHNDINELVEALGTFDLEKLNLILTNDLLAPALKISKQLFNLYQEISKDYTVHMSGSGPTLFIFGHHNLDYADCNVIKTYLLSDSY